MTTKADYNGEEWAAIVEAPLLAGMRVVAAGRGGTLRESLAIGKVYAEARQGHGESELLDQLLASPPGVDPQSLKGGGDVSALSTERLREALRLVSERGGDQEAQAYAGFVRRVARAAAEAHKEGGFVGIGGKPVSDEEQRALDELETLLGAGQPGPAA